jgi:hypothetical protein
MAASAPGSGALLRVTDFVWAEKGFDEVARSPRRTGKTTLCPDRALAFFGDK